MSVQRQFLLNKLSPPLSLPFFGIGMRLERHETIW